MTATIQARLGAAAMAAILGAFGWLGAAQAQDDKSPILGDPRLALLSDDPSDICAAGGRFSEDKSDWKPLEVDAWIDACTVALVDCGSARCTQRKWLSHAVRGALLASKEDLQLALIDFDAAVANLKGVAMEDAHVGRAWVRWRLGMNAEALKDIERLGFFCESVRCRLVHAHILSSLGRGVEALAVFEEALKESATEGLLVEARVRDLEEALVLKGYQTEPVNGAFDDGTRVALIACIADDCRLMERAPSRVGAVGPAGRAPGDVAPVETTPDLRTPPAPAQE